MDTLREGRARGLEPGQAWPCCPTLQAEHPCAPPCCRYITLCTAYWTLHVRSILFIVQVCCSAALPARVPVLKQSPLPVAPNLQPVPPPVSCAAARCQACCCLRKPPALPSYWSLKPNLAQSTAHGAAYLESRIEAFLPAVRAPPFTACQRRQRPPAAVKRGPSLAQQAAVASHLRPHRLILPVSISQQRGFPGYVPPLLLQLAERLEGMAAEEFGAHVEELAKSKAEAPKRLREAAGRDWGEIDQGSLRWVGVPGGRDRG